MGYVDFKMLEHAKKPADAIRLPNRIIHRLLCNAVEMRGGAVIQDIDRIIEIKAAMYVR